MKDKTIDWDALQADKNHPDWEVVKKRMDEPVQFDLAADMAVKLRMTMGDEFADRLYVFLGFGLGNTGK